MNTYVFDEEKKAIRETLCPNCYQEFKQRYIETNTETNEDRYSSCPHCSDANTLSVEKAVLTRHLLLLQEIKRNTPKVVNIGVPKRYSDKTIHDYETTWLDDFQANKAEIALMKVTEYIEKHFHRKTNLIMCGNKGTGKTMLASIIANTLTNTVVHFTTTSQIYMDIIESYKNDNQSVILNSYIFCDLLVIDEVGNRKRDLKPHERDMLFHIMNKRYEMMKPVIIISNCKDVDAYKVIEGEFGERIRDRLFENHAAIYFDWQSFRSKNYNRLNY